MGVFDDLPLLGRLFQQHLITTIELCSRQCAAVDADDEDSVDDGDEAAGDNSNDDRVNCDDWMFGF